MPSDPPTPDGARRRLYEIMAGDGSFEAKAERALELGRTYLGVDHAHLGRVLLCPDYREAVAGIAPADVPAFDANPGVCDRTVRALDGESTTATLALEDGAFDTRHEPLVRDGGDPAGTVGFAYHTDPERHAQAGAE